MRSRPRSCSRLTRSMRPFGTCLPTCFCLVQQVAWSSKIQLSAWPRLGSGHLRPAPTCFADREIFYGPITEYADERMAVIPDFIANCGMARVFAYLMGDEDVDMSDAAIFADICGDSQGPFPGQGRPSSPNSGHSQGF